VLTLKHPIPFPSYSIARNLDASGSYLWTVPPVIVQGDLGRPLEMGHYQIAASLVSANYRTPFNIQRHLTSRRTLRVFRDQAMVLRREGG